MYLIVLTHELGHITIGIIFKYDIKQIKIYPFGGYTIFNTFDPSSGIIGNKLNSSIVVL